MIFIKCPHCHVGLKVDEGKIPLDIASFKCPKCKQFIPISLLSKEDRERDNNSETQVLFCNQQKGKMGYLSVTANEFTPEQTIPLHEGTLTVGRKTTSQLADIGIETTDKAMSRKHIQIEIKKDTKGVYKHFLSDNKSKNHTLYNSKYLKDGEIVVMNNGDEIIIGRTVLHFYE